MLSFLRLTVSCLCIALILPGTVCYAGRARPMLEKGWQELVRDNDTEALRYFGMALIESEKENDTLDKAQALLYMGICYYSVSYSQGLEYCMRAMEEYKKLEKTAPAKAFEGRSRCLQLVSTIESRQGNYQKAVALSREAMKGFPERKDTTGYLGLIYNSLGSAYNKLKMPDSSSYFHRLALAEHLRSSNSTYLPTAYIQVAAIESTRKNKKGSLDLYKRAMKIADSTGNRQAQVSALIGLGEWQLAFGKNYKEAENYFQDANTIAAGLNDKAFGLKTLEHLLALYKETGNYQQAINYQEAIVNLKDSMYSWDRKKEIKSLEIQFDVAEKDRQLKLIQKEKEITVLTNYLLWGGIGTLVLLSGGIILMLRRINKRDKLLLLTKEALVSATETQKRLIEEQKLLKEQQMQQDLEFKESQLSAMTLQMLQKNELMHELKERLEEDQSLSKDQKLGRIISKGLNQDKEWSDFNTHFESINKHFYVRLKFAYPDISPNDLKICALIKLNLSIKEMAAILNISPDSVKTARYRLRKKLQLNNEDNLTAFIMGL